MHVLYTLAPDTWRLGNIYKLCYKDDKVKARRIDMPNLAAEKALRQAVVKVEDETTFEQASSLIKNPELDINAKGAESGKTALNFAIEKLFIPLVKEQECTQETSALRLKIIDKLLEANADIEALKHPNTIKLIQAVQQRASLIKLKISDNVKIGQNAPAAEFNFLTTFFKDINLRDQLFISVYYFYQEMIAMVKLIRSLEDTHNADVLADKFADITNKVIVIFESHGDAGTDKLLSKIKPRLIKSGYTNLCFELPFNSKTYLSKLSPIAHEQEFADKLVFVDPRREHQDPINMILETFAHYCLGPTILMSLRDKGIFFKVCQAALKHDGKIIVISGVAHNALISKLGEIKIPHAAIVPFVDPDKLCLVEDDNGNFASKFPPEHNLALIFSKFAAKALHITDSNESSVDKTLDQFLRLNLGM
jgi:hypothetical protein